VSITTGHEKLALKKAFNVRHGWRNQFIS